MLFFFQTHLVCVVPPYRHQNITEPVTVRLYVVSSGKNSEAHQFVYTPINGAVPSGKLALISIKYLIKTKIILNVIALTRNKLLFVAF